jgi:hypothetical protein
VAALVVSVVALALSIYGGLVAEQHLAGSPLNQARLAPGAAFTRDSETARGVVAFVGFGLPVLLGVAGAAFGTRVMRRLGTGPEDRVRHLAAVFAVMIGGLAAVVAVCMLIAVYGWHHVPHYYTA